MARETSPCSDETALARRDILSASTVMQNSSSSLFGSTRPQLMSCRGRAPAFRAAARGAPRSRCAEKRSWPAGTGVCVVKTTCAETRRAASSAPMPSLAIRCRTSSSAANALCPSLRCTTPGEMPSARAPARRRRRAAAPAGCGRGRRRRRAATSARDLPGWLPSTLESSSSSVLRPTESCQTRAVIVPVRVSIVTVTGTPLLRGRLNGQQAAVDVQVVLVLPAVAVEPLPEIALVVVQADADERNAEVRRALDVIAGQDAEAARVDRDRFVQPELGGEVGHRPRPRARRRAGRPRCASSVRYSCIRR